MLVEPVPLSRHADSPPRPVTMSRLPAQCARLFCASSGRAIAAAVTMVAALSAQCANHWLAGGSFPGPAGSIYDIEPWDPDGAGPAAPVLVMCGQFVSAGPILDVNRIVTYDPATGVWGTLGTGMTDALGSSQVLVTSLAVLVNGDLVAGGTFTSAGGTPVDRIARWDGISWQPLGTGVSGGPIGIGPSVNDLQVLPNGDLIVVGDFMFAGGVPVSSVARWDGTTWWPVGSGVAGRFDCVTSRPNGDIFVSGLIGIGGGNWGANIARWDGTNWSCINPTPGGTNGPVSRLRVLQNGDVIAG